MNVSRRVFLKRAGLVGVSASVVGTASNKAVGSHTPEPSEDPMGVLVDLHKCRGCRHCESACREANGFGALTDEELLDKSVFTKHRRPAPDAHTTVNRYPGRGDAAEPKPVFVKSNCLHCIDPACMSACLVGAFSKEPNGAVVYDPWKCMGCRYCMVACPFQIPTYEYDNALTPQVRKCMLCANEGNPNRGGVPACVQKCPEECLSYGKRSELLALAHDQIERYPDVYIDRVYGEHEAGGTSWLYLSSVPFEELGFLNLDPEAPARLTEAIQHSIFKHWMPPVAWFGLLGLVMHLFKPENEQATATLGDASAAEARRDDTGAL